MRIAVIGDFDKNRPSHSATVEALYHSADQISAELEITWFPSHELETHEVISALSSFSGVFGAPGEPNSSLGFICGIRAARERGIPFLGT